MWNRIMVLLGPKSPEFWEDLTPSHKKWGPSDTGTLGTQSLVPTAQTVTPQIMYFITNNYQYWAMVQQSLKKGSVWLRKLC